MALTTRLMSVATNVDGAILSPRGKRLGNIVLIPSVLVLIVKNPNTAKKRGCAEQERESQRITVLSNLVVFSGPHGMANLHVEKGDPFHGKRQVPVPQVHCMI